MLEESEQAPELELDMTGMLALSDQELKITMMNMLRVLMEKVDNMQEQIGNISREMNI